MSSQHHFHKAADTVLHVVPLQDYLNDTIPVTQSIFLRPRYTRRLVKYCLVSLAHWSEHLFGVSIYCENSLKELRLVSPEARRTLAALVSEGLLASWVFDVHTPEAVPIHHVKLRFKPLQLPNGVVVRMGGSNGAGVGDSVEEALVPAVGELLERHASISWTHRTDIIKSSYQELLRQKVRCFDPLELLAINTLNIDRSPQLYSTEAHTTPVDWLRGTSFITGEAMCVPASTVYMWYTTVDKTEPFFWEISSNAAAAHTSMEDAVLGAVSECIERDAFLGYWLNTLVPNKISLQSIRQQIPGVCDKLDFMSAHGFEAHVLHLRTDLGLEVVVTVGLDVVGGNGVAVSAAAGHDLKHLVRKALYEMFKFTNYNAHTVKPIIDNHFDPVTNTWKVDTLSERLALWTNNSMIEHMRWFLSGSECSLSELVENSQYKYLLKATTSEKLTAIKKHFEKQHYESAWVDITAPLTRSMGLRAARFVAPDTIPIYFNETHKPLRRKRVEEFPVRVGLREAASAIESLNPIPHPFA